MDQMDSLLDVMMKEYKKSETIEYTVALLHRIVNTQYGWDVSNSNMHYIVTKLIKRGDILVMATVGHNGKSGKPMRVVASKEVVELETTVQHYEEMAESATEVETVVVIETLPEEKKEITMINDPKVSMEIQTSLQRQINELRKDLNETTNAIPKYKREVADILHTMGDRFKVLFTKEEAAAVLEEMANSLARVVKNHDTLWEVTHSMAKGMEKHTENHSHANSTSSSPSDSVSLELPTTLYQEGFAAGFSSGHKSGYDKANAEWQSELKIQTATQMTKALNAAAKALSKENVEKQIHNTLIRAGGHEPSKVSFESSAMDVIKIMPEELMDALLKMAPVKDTFRGNNAK